MFTQIMAPVDLAHAERLGRALGVTADLARHYGAPVCYVAVGAATPGKLAHTPQEFQQKLDAFAAEQAAKHGHSATAKALITPDPAVDMDDSLLKAVEQVGADLVVMASHVPGVADYLLPSHGGRMASHSGASVLIVRPD
ncbi:universal stress protein [Actibacterium ureilyticum]|uniref:universal stress protein n=1 Tax=Actibacterium ureilyticum TaxID=1590614 RepID=UPI000BAAC633|nr:universal stress protein [Actibacterium ureilyticum]